MLNVNFTGQFLGIQARAPLMKRTGGRSIVNLGSAAGIMCHLVAGNSTSKWGLRGLTNAAATKFAAFVIWVYSPRLGSFDRIPFEHL